MKPERTIYDLIRDIKIWMAETKREIDSISRAENLFK